MILGVSGYARCGKDEVAKILAEEFGYQRVAFADKLRECLYELNPIVAVDAARAQTTYYRVQDVIDSFGWDGYKSTPYGNEVRTLLQRLGTEVGRETLYDSIWVDAALDNDITNLVIPDTRFENEAEAIRQRGGRVIRVNRPGVHPANNHISETGLDNYDFDYVIENDGTLEDLRVKVRSMMTWES